MNSTQSNGSLSISHFTYQNNKVQIDYPLAMASRNRHVQIDKVIVFTPMILGIFILENPIKKLRIVIMNMHYRQQKDKRHGELNH